jgi:hypothetical protein
MAIPASGAFRASAIRDTFGGPQTFRLGSYRRAPAGPYVYQNAANNPATNRAAAVTVVGVPLRLNVFRSQLPGWDYVNSAVQLNNYYINSGFGDNWETNWPKAFTNNNVIGSTSVSTYAALITGGKGRVDFVNNSEIQGGGGQPNSNPGQIALRVQVTCDLHVTNNGAIRGGGGAGGVGGAGGTGGTGYYQVWTYEPSNGTYVFTDGNAGPFFSYSPSGGGTYIKWYSTSFIIVSGFVTEVSSGGYVYERGPLQLQRFGNTYYAIRRRSLTNVYVGGAAGGAGGNGGRGIGYNSPNLGGSPGAGGGNNGGNSGTGGTGGIGGTGGSWGLPGGTGATGATGATGNYAGGTGGSAGGAGGAGGYSIYADSAWHFPVRGTTNGPIGPTQPS